MKTNYQSNIIWVGIVSLAIVMLSMVIDLPEISFKTLRQAFAIYDGANAANRIWIQGNTWRFKTALSEYSLEDLGIDTGAAYTAGDALTLTGTDFDFDGGATPGGELGGTWASPTIDSTHSGSAHHSAVTLSGTPDYITLSSQDIVRGLIDLVSDITGILPLTNLTSSTRIYLSDNENRNTLTADGVGLAITLAANTYSYIKAAAEGYMVGAANTASTWNIWIRDNSVQKGGKTVLDVPATGAGDTHTVPFNISTVFTETTSQSLDVYGDEIVDGATLVFNKLEIEGIK